MRITLEQLDYQERAINSTLSVFRGQERNPIDAQTLSDIHANVLSLNRDDIKKNILGIATKNGIPLEKANISDVNSLCIEMETGTGKTLVYIKTIFELSKRYGFTKFIVLTPSIAIKEGVLSTLENFEKQLEDLYNIKPRYFEYDSARLSNVTAFIEDRHPQIMVMTLQSFNSDDRVLNQKSREDLFSNMPYIEAIAKTNPIVIMDEPQEGMDTENAVRRVKALNPLFEIRYSATHKIITNLIYRLTPFDSYKQGLVKKIEVLTVSEKNDEASTRLELASVELGKGDPKAVINAWHASAGGFKFKKTKKLGKNASLYEATGNIIYKDYTIDQIAKPIRSKGFVKFKNEAVIYEGDQAKDHSAIFGEQLYWLIDTHFRKKEKLKKLGVKCLSLVFIDRVDNYIRPDGTIRKAFEAQYAKVNRALYGAEATTEQINACQGYYFAQTGKGDYTDNLRSMETNKALYDLILRDKEALLSFDNPVEFIFSHSALGVGWDNPNVFNIATLNQSYSEIKKRQEIGRGLRICLNQEFRRVYDQPTTPEGDEINLLTVIPNETYETFVAEYQSEIAEIYGSERAGAETRNNHKGEKRGVKTIARNDARFNSPSFREFWRRLARKTDYLVSFDETRVIGACADALNAISVPEHTAEISLDRIREISETNVETTRLGKERKTLRSFFSPLDIIEELSENTALAYPTVFEIVKKLNNGREIVKNPPVFIRKAIGRIREIELDEMLRALEYRVNDEKFDIAAFAPFFVRNTERIIDTPNRGVYDRVVYDSDYEKAFAQKADTDTEVVCFLKLPDFYAIKTPAGDYRPDFGVVMRKKKLRDETENEYYFVIETKGTNDIGDRKALTEDESYKIKCAVKHFDALGIEAKIHYCAPIKEYETFKEKTNERSA